MKVDIDQLRALVDDGESDQLEFKKSTNQIRAAMQTLCGLLNERGGRVVIGVTPDIRIVGQQVSDSTLRDIATELRRFEPPAPIGLERIKVDKRGNEVIVLTSDPSNEIRPYVYDGRPYQKIGTSVAVMPQAKYEQLLLDRAHAKKRWENSLAEDYSLDDLDKEEILRTIRIGIENRRIPESTGHDAEDFLDRLRLRENGTLLNSAIVLFGKRMMPDFPQCELRMARFKGKDKTEFLDERQVRGHVFMLLEEALLFLDRHLPLAGRVEPGKSSRVVKHMFPPDALREALVNAFCHRDYSIQGGSVRVAIFDDRLEIWSDGKLPSGLTIADLSVDHPSRLRNPIIADVLYRRGLVERWGRGTQRIIELCIGAGHPSPVFVEQAGAIGVRFLPSGYIAPHRVSHALSKRQREILGILSDAGAIPFHLIRERMEKPPADRTIRDDLAFLKKTGLIESRGFGRGAFWSLRRNKAENKAE
jgi:ATP-dependent DNA helicase RecG